MGWGGVACDRIGLGGVEIFIESITHDLFSRQYVHPAS